jgi:hypothetical protein
VESQRLGRESEEVGIVEAATMRDGEGPLPSLGESNVRHARMHEEKKRHKSRCTCFGEDLISTGLTVDDLESRVIGIALIYTTPIVLWI